ncbi:MAG: hypothetical protein H7A44_06275 [Opitutaceae bacterium]|nr:hypothetical protein [Cephaloticoccus sp.]MCP5530029.1 hypothetical protein [Opitutaceae bacterium]
MSRSLSSLTWALILLAAMSGCQTAGRISPEQAVMAAAAAAPAGVDGVFTFTVQATGEDKGYVYLNSQADYRDQRNLSVEIPPAVRRELWRKFGADPIDYFKGKTIRVIGTAQRVKIWFNFGGYRTEKYYYQTHVMVRDADQITALPKSVRR